MYKYITLILIAILLTACGKSTPNQEKKDRKAVARQQSQYAASQPIPVYDWSLERDLVIQLYNSRNLRALTHSVWRSDRGMIEGDCASIGFGVPYDTSLTNPLKIAVHSTYGVGITEQPEPNGIFASKNTSATWVMCAGTTGTIEPIYIETKVTVYPYPVKVAYDTNRVTKAGKATVVISNK